MLATFPYYLSYYNPLLGGSARAPAVMQIGWGEGADRAARLLAEQPNAAEKVVASAYTNGPFSYFFPGKTLPITFWHQADYAVLYAQDFQRRLPSPRQIRYFESLEPADTVVLDGLAYAKIYALDDVPLPSYVTDWRLPNQVEAKPLIRLVSYQLPSSTLTAGESLPLTLYFQGLQTIDADFNVIVRLVDAAGNEVGREEGWPWGSPTTSWQPNDVWPDGHSLNLAENTTPGPIRVEVAFNDPAQSELLTAIQTETGEVLGEWLTLDYVAVGEIVDEPTMRQTPAPTLGEFVQFNGLLPRVASDNVQSGANIEAQPGDTVTLDLFWETLAHVELDYTVFVHIVGADGQMLVQRDQQPLGGFYPTSFWQKGRTVVDAVSLDIPEDAAPGAYSVYVGMYDLATVERLLVRQWWRSERAMRFGWGSWLFRGERERRPRPLTQPSRRVYPSLGMKIK